MAKISSKKVKNQDTPSSNAVSVPKTLQTPQQVIESVIFSGVKRSDEHKKPSIFEERLLAYIILEAQKCLRGIKISDHLSDDINDIEGLLTPEMRTQKYYPMKIPLKEIAGTSNNYNHIANACSNLMSKIVRVDSGTHYRLRQLIVGVDYAKDGSGYLCFDVPREVWLAILDFSKGYRKYEVRMAAVLTNPYAYLLYKFIASLKGKEGDWSVSYLREQLQLKDKYPRIADLKKKILTPAVFDLDTFAPISCRFTFYTSKQAQDGRRGAPVQDRVKIIPVVKLGEGSHDELAYQLPGRRKIDLLPKKIVEYLKIRFLYDDVWLERHAEKLINAYETMKVIEGGFAGFLMDLTTAIDRVRPDSYPKYLMTCINNKVAKIKQSCNDTDAEQNIDEFVKPVVPAVEETVQPQTNKNTSEFKKFGDLLNLKWEN